MVAKLGMERVIDSAFNGVKYNSVAPLIQSDSDFAARTAMTGVHASGEDLANRPGGGAMAEFAARTNMVVVALDKAGLQRAAYRASLVPPMADNKVGVTSTVNLSGGQPKSRAEILKL